MEQKIRLGISACLLGQEVRYDGGHKLDPFLRDTLGQFVAYVPVCPEVECGLEVPREAMRLVGDPENPRLVTIRSARDLTDRMLTYAAGRVRELEGEGLCGFIFKSKSPSSGMERVKVYPEEGKGAPSLKGVGLFARAFKAHFPRLPVEEEGRLHDPVIRETFIDAVFALRSWRELLDGPRDLGNLVAFHTDHKLLLLAHDETLYRKMGRLVATGKEVPVRDLFDAYEALLMEALRRKGTRRRHVNVLQHLMGYFKRMLTPDEKAELLEVIGQYADGHVPLLVPVTLVNHYVRKYREPYLMRQVYLRPHPVSLQLRNHV